MLLVFLACFLSTEALRSPLGRVYQQKSTLLPSVPGQAGGPLFLTPYIEAGQLELARNLSRVEQLNGTDVESYTGYLTVNKPYSSNLYFWFFPAKSEPGSAPLLLWLQGGPGAPSLYGLFVEHGPFSVNEDLQLVPRNLSWYNTHNLLYIDNPVGAGFSFTESEAGYAANEEDVAGDLYRALVQFFTLFSDYKSNDFYVTGESYAGKYVPSISYKIHLENPTAEVKINLKGMSIGDGLCDPINQIDYGDFLYNIGLVDAKQTLYFHQQANKTGEFILQREFVEAFHAWDIILNGDRISPTYFNNVTGFVNYYNYLFPIAPNDLNSNAYSDFLNLPETRLAIHVGGRPFNDGVKAEDHLLADIMNSSKPMIAAVLDAGYQVLVYNGQLDVAIPYPLTQKWLKSVSWSGAEDYRRAERSIWQVGDDLAGYVRVARNLHEVLVRSSGHMVPYDQPLWAYRLINTFTGADGSRW